MSEFIVIQVGQCGNQIGSSLLPEILQEYHINFSHDADSTPTIDKFELQRCMSTFINFNTEKYGNKVFNELSDLIKIKAKLRFLCIDMEDNVVSRVKVGKFRDLYDKKCLITNYPGSGNNWAEGFYTHGPKYENKILKTLAYMIEKCDNVLGFFLIFSMGGGTGSGLGTFVLNLLETVYPKIERFVVCVYPTGIEDVVTAPYNVAFATEQLISNATCVFPIENRALLDIYTQKTQRFSNNKTISEVGTFEDVNKIIVDMILHLTSGPRFGGKFNIDLNDINTNMIPFPKINFLSSGFAPFQLKLVDKNIVYMKNELFLTCCNRTSQLVKVDPLNSRSVTMSITLLGRGNYTIHEMHTYVNKLKKKLRFANWSNKAIRIGLCDMAPKNLEYSMFSLCNTTEMAHLFKEVNNQLAKLYNRKAHVHHYTAISDFSIESFAECQNNITDVVKTYSDIENFKQFCIN